MLQGIIFHCIDDFNANYQPSFLKDNEMTISKRSVTPRRDFLKAGAVALSALPVVSGVFTPKGAMY